MIVSCSCFRWLGFDDFVVNAQPFYAYADVIDARPEVTITHFRPDVKKEGGEYVTTAGILKRIDGYEYAIVLDGGEIIRIPDILDIESELFENL